MGGIFGIDTGKDEKKTTRKGVFHMSTAGDTISNDDRRLAESSNDYNDYRIKRDEEGHDSPPLDRGTYKAVKDKKL